MTKFKSRTCFLYIFVLIIKRIFNGNYIKNICALRFSFPNHTMKHEHYIDVALSSVRSLPMSPHHPLVNNMSWQDCQARSACFRNDTLLMEKMSSSVVVTNVIYLNFTTLNNFNNSVYLTNGDLIMNSNKGSSVPLWHLVLKIKWDLWEKKFTYYSSLTVLHSNFE